MAGTDTARRAAAAVPAEFPGTALPHTSRKTFRSLARLGSRRQDQRVGPRLVTIVRSWISKAPNATVGKFPGPFPTRTSLLTTTASINSSAFAAAMTIRTLCRAAAITCLPAPALRRSALEESCPARWHSHRSRPSRRLNPPSQRICSLPLLRCLRPWLRYRVVLQFCRSPHSGCSEVGPPHTSYQCCSRPDTAQC